MSAGRKTKIDLGAENGSTSTDRTKKSRYIFSFFQMNFTLLIK